MAQHIGLSKIDKSGRTIDNSPINFAEIINILWTIPDFKNNFPMLSEVDPYSNTILDKTQTKSLINDLNKLSLNTKNKNLKNTVKEIKEFISGSDNFNIKFTGD